MSENTENFFRQSFSNWSSNRQQESEAASFPQLNSWADYVRTEANDLYSRLPLYNNDTVEEPSWFTLSRVEKLLVFACCLGGSALCFTIGIFLFPVLALKPRKFGLLWSLGSFLFVISFGALQGPMNYLVHLTSKDRLPFTVVFFGSVFLTMYSALVWRSTIMTIFASVIEIFAVLYYTVSYFPFGAQSLRWLTSYGTGYFGGLVGLQ